MNIYFRSGFELKKKNVLAAKLVTGNTKIAKWLIFMISYCFVNY
jgi:hypothetical protein